MRHDILFGLGGTTHCYTLVKRLYNMPHSKSYCEQSLYGHLADISDKNEQEHVQQFLNHYIHGHFAWIGLHREDGSYKWSSGNVINTHFN